MFNFLSRCCSRVLVRLQNLKPAVFEPYKRKRTTMDKGEQHWISRVNNQVNYERTFYSPEKIDVSVPTLPYQAFDLYLSGTRIKPWNLIDLIVSVRLFTQYPVEHAGNPCDSIVDTHLLMKENILFFVSLKIDINRHFHNPDSPKFPLTVTAEVTHAGNSSTRRRYTVKHTSMSSPCITCETDDVLVNKSSRRPTAFPDWWVKKYSNLIKPKMKFEKPLKKSDAFTNKSEMKVEFEHLDHNLHTTTRAYLKFAINATFKTAASERHGYIGIEHLRAGIKCIQMFFHGESNYGDILIVQTFENKSNKNEVLIEIRKHSASQEKELECCTVVLEFYEPTKLDIPGKL
ncbi:uncharacterized protein LOC123561193 [Mercenaria mercenaria]|uniref:uncharacterized protein LOC123561193 n=1 Tax=Mercenaria mercenaria TaxID=6596 RepID=UPI00234F9DA0|nr:uncharacterized protein LOC123561193 [Mercenaria mercenaria]